MNILAADLGGASLRVGLVNEAGELITSAAAPLPTRCPREGWAEQSPDLWWAEFQRLSAKVLAAGAERPRALALTGVTRTQILVDGEGCCLRPAVLWRDTRARAEAEILADVLPAVQANPFHPLARLLWFKSHEPDIWRLTARVLQPKDYLALRLSGVAAGDRISSQPFLDAEGEVDDKLFQALDLESSLIPPLLAPEAEVGRVRSDLDQALAALAGLPVFCGCMDTWCCTLGSGANRAGRGYIISGTSEVAGVLVTRAVQAPGLVTLPWGDGLWQLGGPSQAGADCLNWLGEILRFDDSLDAELQRLQSVPRRALAPLFLPYLAGERTPLWNADARGLWFGLERQQGRDELIWSVIEGVALHNRQVLDLAETASGASCTAVHIAGGAARSDLWCQLRADVSGRTVLRPAVPEAGLLGAAMTALQGLGVYPDRLAVQDALVRIEREFQPCARRHAVYTELYALFRRLAESAGDDFTRLARIRHRFGEESRQNLRDLWSRS